MASTNTNFKTKIINLENKLIKFKICVIAGQERFNSTNNTYYKVAQGIILMYDVTDEISFLSTFNYIKQIEQNAQDNVCKVLVGNKCDKPDRKLREEKGRARAKTNQNAEEIFTFLVREILITFLSQSSGFIFD